MNVQRSPNKKTLFTAAVLGLFSGLLLSIPLSRSLIPSTEVPNLVSVSNPFEGWSSFDNENIVVLGMDAGGGNTDTIFILGIENGETSIIQIPRDSYIDSRSFGSMKANALHARGGPDAVKTELTRLMGRPINHHILVNLEGIRTISDLLGGLEVDVPKRLYYQDKSQGLLIDLQPGPQLLKGRELEGFLRWRHDGEGDFGRLDRQQLVLKSLFNKLIKPQHLIRLPALITAAGRNLETDLGPMELGKLITTMGTTELQTSRLKARPFYQNGVSYLDTQWPANVPERGIDSSESSSRRFQLLF
ncbi:LCP family protein [Synechococcus sp. ROS8604]|uniref:LCP family protein n=1 Tax=Synechococcus sp. ROS8604 TaxID=1442557 RepID=UPI0016445CD0|nr:LCP family protein [Synechococcus sp. ROS8604]QNI88067.1 cell envelope-related transcriptional attenuator domain-containing protein [Synechococcus sp. ROS8604]